MLITKGVVCMYNESVKMRFVDTLGSDAFKRYAICLFNRFGDIAEDGANCDVADMSRESFIGFMEQFNYLTYHTIFSDLVILRKYFLWYNKNVHEIDSESLCSVTYKDIDLSESIRKQLLKNKEEVLEIVSHAPAEDGYFENPVLLLSWVGLTLKEILGLKNEDISFEDGYATVNSDKRIYIITSEEITSKLLDYKNVKRSTRARRHVDLDVYPDDLGYFIKSMQTLNSVFSGKRLVEGNIRKKVGAYVANLPDQFKRVTIDDVLLSGRMFRIYEYETKYNTDLNQKIINEMRIKKSALAEYLQLYKCYKKAFGLNIENKAE